MKRKSPSLSPNDPLLTTVHVAGSSTLSQEHGHEIDSEGKKRTSCNPFDLMMHASQHAKTKTATFSLFTDSENRLHPSFVFENELLEEVKEKSASVWSAEVVLRSKEKTNTNCKLRLLTNIAPSSSDKTDTDKSHATLIRFKAHSSIIKSMLQKAIRRGKVNETAKLAAFLQQLSPEDYYRRIIIICIEDVCLHAGLPILVWLMVATSKGYRPNPFLLSISLRFAIELALNSFRDHLPLSLRPINNSSASPPSLPRPSSSAPSTSNATSSSSHPFDLTSSLTWDMLSKTKPSPGRCLVASLLIRCSYGGMECDVHMLADYSLLWYHRLLFPCTASNSSSHSTNTPQESICAKDASPYTYLSSSYISSLCLEGPFAAICLDVFTGFDKDCLSLSLQRLVHQSYGTSNDLPLSADCLIPEGIDFHCDSQLIKHLLHQSAGHGINEKDIKACIWLFRSSVNIRKPLPFEEIILVHQLIKEKEIKEKQGLRHIWRVLAPLVGTYCDRKVNTLTAELTKSLQISF